LNQKQIESYFDNKDNKYNDNNQGNYWSSMKLKDVVTEDKKQIKPQEFPKEEFWVLTMDCVESETGRLVKEVYNFGSNIKSIKVLFNKKHILYGKLRPYLNKVYTTNCGEGICSPEFIPMLPNENLILKDYLVYFLRSKRVVDFAMDRLTGARQPRVDMKLFYELDVPLPFSNGQPDLELQQRIVQKIEKLYGRINKVQILNEKISREAENLLMAVLQQKFTNMDVNFWKWIKFEYLIDNIRTGGTPSTKNEKYWNGDIPWITTKHLTNADVYTGDRFLTKEAILDKKTGLAKSGSVLIATRVTIGKISIASRDLAYNQDITGIELKLNIILPKFFYYFYKSPVSTNILNSLSCKTTVGRLSRNSLYSLKIPLPLSSNGKPDLTKQKHIVKILDEISKNQTLMLEQITNTKTAIEKLKQSILHKAFTGELVKK